jgi:hypothetical protein
MDEQQQFIEKALLEQEADERPARSHVDALVGLPLELQLLDALAADQRGRPQY